MPSQSQVSHCQPSSRRSGHPPAAADRQPARKLRTLRLGCAPSAITGPYLHWASNMQRTTYQHILAMGAGSLSHMVARV